MENVLMFDANGILARPRGLTFDDVLLIPRHSEISSRMHPNLKTQLTKKYEIDLPFVASNMDTISEVDMCKAMMRLGGIAILHRFMSVEEQLRQIKEIQSYKKSNGFKTPTAASIGVKEEGEKRAAALVDAGIDILTIDIAHGDSVMMLDTLTKVKGKYPMVDVIAGNVATPDGVKRMIDAGADAVKVGIGPGSMCTTRIITGHGVPQLTAIALCYQEARKHNVPVVADGGIRNSGDIVKALAAGGATVMLGSMLSGTIETPGEVKGGKKQYRGMASKAAQVSWRGELPEGMAAEGESTMIPCKGSVDGVILELSGGIRSGMSYLNAREIAEIKINARFMEITPSGMAESKPHGVR